MQNTDPIRSHVDAHRDAFVALADRVFDTSETLCTEFLTVAEHRKAREAQGFA